MSTSPDDYAFMPLSSDRDDRTPFLERWESAACLFGTADPCEMVPEGVRLVVTVGLMDGVPHAQLDAIVGRIIGTRAIERLCEILAPIHRVRYSPEWIRRVAAAEATDASLTLSHAGIDRAWESMKIDAFLWSLLGLAGEPGPAGD